MAFFKRFVQTVMRLALILLLSATLNPAMAQNERALSDLLSGNVAATSRENRAAAARELLGEVKRLAEFVPTPSPDDVRWVETESAAIPRLSDPEAQLSRRLKLFEAPAFQLVKVHNYLAHIQEALKCAMNRSVELKMEIYCWATAGFMLTENSVFEDGVQVLVRSARLDGEALQRARIPANGIGLIFRLHGRGIYEHLVLRYLSGALPK